MQILNVLLMGKYSKGTVQILNVLLMGKYCKGTVQILNVLLMSKYCRGTVKILNVLLMGKYSKGTVQILCFLYIWRTLVLFVGPLISMFGIHPWCYTRRLLGGLLVAYRIPYIQSRDRRPRD